MHIRTIALLSTVVAGTVSCAEGSVTELPSSTTAKSPATASTETPADPPPAQASAPAPSTPPPPPASTEVTGSYSLDVACADIPVIHLCILARNADKDVPFPLPPGTKRSSIVYTINPLGPAAGGSVSFASDDPLDATVHMHAWADALSSVEVQVTGVMAVPE